MHPRLPLPEASDGDDLESFLAWLREAIPQVAHYGIHSPAWDATTLHWQVALDANLNDKGTGFGGALAGETTLLGWCWTTLWLRARGRAQDVVIAEGQQRFLAPVTTDYHMQCFPLEADGIARLEASLAEKGEGALPSCSASTAVTPSAWKLKAVTRYSSDSSPKRKIACKTALSSIVCAPF